MNLAVLLILSWTVLVSSVEDARYQDEDSFFSPLELREMELDHPTPPSDLPEELKPERSLLSVDAALPSSPSVKVTLPS
jgi:hypothetical protein